MKKIHLGGRYGSIIGNYALVDDEDFEWLNQWKWCNQKLNGKISYVIRNMTTVEAVKNRGKRGLILMHREILNTPKGMDTDHINHNSLDNRKENLRICTSAENQWNSKKSKRNASGYKGVSWHKKNKKWQAHIGFNRKLFYLGYFTNKKEAAKAYNKKAKELFGQFANSC